MELHLTKGETRGVAKLMAKLPDDGLEWVKIARDVHGDLFVTTLHMGRRAQELRHAGKRHYYIGPRGRVEETGPPAVAERAPA